MALIRSYFSLADIYIYIYTTFKLKTFSFLKSVKIYSAILYLHFRNCVWNSVANLKYNLEVLIKPVVLGKRDWIKELVL